MKTRFALCLCVFAIIASPLHAQNAAPPAAQPAALSAADLAFGRNIAVIRGHLLTGDELAAQRNWDSAAIYFSYPREEVYGLIRQDVRTYKVPAFDDALRALVSAAKARNAKQFPRARERVEAALDAADAALKAKQQNWPRFKLAAALALLKTAPDEYDDAVQKGRVVRPTGFQTARGFVLQAERMIESVSGNFTGDANAAALAEIRAGFAELKAAQPSVSSPKDATLDDSGFQKAVGKIDAAAARLS